MLTAFWFWATICVDEAEGITVMISEWLELDAADDWVRYDAEIVCLLYIHFTSSSDVVLYRP